MARLDGKVTLITGAGAGIGRAAALLFANVSEREYQLERGSQWDKGKGCDTFGPTGPWLVTKDEVPYPQVLAMWADLDGVRMQSGNTRTMIFSVAKIVSFLSEIFTLHPGGIIVTGTPLGVGVGKKPNRFSPSRDRR
jgi:2,4-diketo-3-deoxy-L-fuconate hydrolase